MSTENNTFPYHSHRLLQYVIEHDRSAIALLNRELRYIYVSQRFLTDYNVKEKDVLGKRHYEIFPDLPDAWREVHQRSLEGEIITADDDAYVKADGSTVWVRWECRPWYESDDSIGGIILYTEVITKQKEAERELINAKEKAEESDRLKTEFLQNMSHEVRTPLNAIVGFSQLMARPGESIENLNTFSEILNESSNKLIRIITDVIETASIHANQVKVNPAEFNIIRTVENIVAEYREMAGRKNLDLTLKLDINPAESIIFSDKAKLEKSFDHLVENALKYTVKGSVMIGCEMRDNLLVFSVTDTGIGIDEDKQKIIFEPFRQVETGLSRDYGGNGLGLAIVRAYAELLKGNISLKSEKGKGTTVTMSVPVKIVNKEEKKDTSVADSADGKINTILIAEDEYSNYRYLYEVLHSDRMIILHANNGQEAIDICKMNDTIGLILMDIKMPVMDGASATRAIRKFRPLMPVIAQTAYMQESEKSGYLTVFDDLISKPINRNILKQKMSKFITI